MNEWLTGIALISKKLVKAALLNSRSNSFDYLQLNKATQVSIEFISINSSSRCMCIYWLDTESDKLEHETLDSLSESGLSKSILSNSCSPDCYDGNLRKLIFSLYINLDCIENSLLILFGMSDCFDSRTDRLPLR